VENASGENKPTNNGDDCSDYERELRECRNDALMCIALAVVISLEDPLAGVACLIIEKTCLDRAKQDHPACAGS
jgi:hypothetical protein